MTSDFDTIRAALVRLGPIPDWSVNERAEEALAALSRVEAAAEQTEKALANLVEHIDVNGGCHRGCPEHDDARAALALLRGKDTG